MDHVKQGRNNRIRGAQLERDSVSMAKDHGLQAKRWDISGANDERGDIEIDGLFYGCKRKSSLATFLIPEKQEVGVIIRGDRDVARIVVPLEGWLELVELQRLTKDFYGGKD